VSPFDVEVLRQTEAQAREAFLWHFEKSPIAADAPQTDLFDPMDGLGETAMDWPEDEEGTRHYRFKHFQHTVMYEVI
jgi:hypothetical protein